MKTIIFAGGGTAGHVMPNVAIMQQLKDKANCLYVGTDGIEKQLVTKYFGEQCFFEIECKKLVRKITPKNLALPFAIAKSTRVCKTLLKNLAPSLVFAKGGYVSYPVVKAAHQLGIPVFIHESDFSLGLANRLCARWCDKIFTTFDQTAKRHKNALHVGTPIRQQIYLADKRKGKQITGFDGKRKVITVIGGSLGAKRLNEVIKESIDEITKKYDLFLISGKGKKIDVTHKGFTQTEFVDNVFDIFATSDLIISRSGSNVVCELVAMNKPMILVPLTQATRGEQMQNASYFEKKGCCVIADENTLDKQTLLQKIDFAFANAQSMTKNQKNIKIDGTRKIVEEILKITKS